MGYRNTQTGWPPTDRQLETLADYCRTGSYKDTGANLGISRHTVKNHLWSIHRRMGVETTIEALVKLGWLTIPPV